MDEIERTTAELLEELTARRPELHFSRVGRGKIRLAFLDAKEAALVVGLRPVLAQIRLQPGRRQALIAGFAKTLLDRFEKNDGPAEKTTARLTALIKTTEQVASMRAFLRTHDRGNDLISAPFCGPLAMVLAITEGSAEPEALTQQRVQALGLDEPTLARNAFENLRLRYRAVRRREVEDMPHLHVTRAPLASSLLILADLFAGFAEHCRGELLVVAPARDFLLYADSSSNGVLYDLRVLASNIQEFALDPISDEVIKWTPQGFEPF